MRGGRRLLGRRAGGLRLLPHGGHALLQVDSARRAGEHGGRVRMHRSPSATSRLLPLCLLCLLHTWEALAGKQRCLFVHGTGETYVSPPTDTDTTDYWGGQANVVKATGVHCSSYSFVHMNTVINSWNSSSLQSQVCEAAGASIGGTITNTHIFTHSMGNLIFSGALTNGVCHLGASSNWVSLSALWLGSKAAAWVDRVCTDTSKLSWILRKFADDEHYCNGTIGNLAYRSMKPSNLWLRLGVLRKTAEQFVTASVCGTSPFGIFSKYSAALEAISVAVDFGEKSDGMVGIDSCKLPSRNYATDYHGTNFYMADINHADGTLRDGNGDSADDSPVAWVQSLAL